ncbi:ATP-binding cassette domain-containing protein [Bacillus carboniphilus]|uniref:ATP-binding cassette domain-containing protein n=1 Tax=Bacillus carboniphilus TaxID=86663 RepID=A0ABY9JWA0_9BACI|nr:ATP-binding cassette domain-containing protein [Bacillus carboniphilus]WLR43079.1 ATP-binding cassette domain-containing protein [Bacillus carboniphilus]
MLHLNQIHKLFHQDTPDEKRALNNVSLEIDKGDFVTVIGSNGAGKSTLFNVISGVINPEIGNIYINGQDVTYMKESDRSKFIGRVFQNPLAGTAPNMTIEENLAMAYSRNKRRTIKKAVTKSRKAYFKDLLVDLQLGLENRLNVKVGLLSGGERQALSLLMATFTEPEVLLLDEHTAALDPSRAELITTLTKEIVEKYGLTTIMITHNMYQALELGNKLIMMDRGAIILQVSEEEKARLTTEELLEEFKKIKGGNAVSDRTLLI